VSSATLHFRLAFLGILISISSVFVLGQTAEFEKSFHQGTEAMKTGQWDDASAAFGKATALMPNSAKAYFNLGLAQFQLAHLDDALVAFRHTLTLDPKLRGANLFSGIVQYRKNDYPAAIASLQREIQIDPANAKALMWLGVTQLGAGDSAAASVALDKAAQLSPGDVDILYHRGRAHMLVSKESYEQMYKADPDSWRVHQALAQSFVEADRLEDAANECQVALRLRPSEPGLHEELGDIYWKQNQLEKAESAFQDELKIDTESLSSMYKLGVVSLERAKPEITVAMIGEVLRRAPKYLDAHYQMGRAQAQLGQVDAAIASFSAAVADAGQTDRESLRQSYYQLAQLYRRAQQPEESKKALASFMQLKQQSDEAQAQKLEDKLKRAPEAQQAAR
jgi:superkiller protein 3